MPPSTATPTTPPATCLRLEKIFYLHWSAAAQTTMCMYESEQDSNRRTARSVCAQCRGINGGGQRHKFQHV